MSWWSHAEETMLRRRYRTAKTSKLRELFPGRTFGAIRSHAFHLGLKRDLGQNDISGVRWTLSVPSRQVDLAYMAGILDGEGSICFGFCPKATGGKSYPYVEIEVANTDLGLMAWLKTNFGGNICHGTSSTLTRKQCYRWMCTGVANVAMLLRALFPFLIIKKEKARETMKFIVQHYPRLTRHLRPSLLLKIGKH